MLSCEGAKDLNYSTTVNSTLGGENQRDRTTVDHTEAYGKDLETRTCKVATDLATPLTLDTKTGHVNVLDLWSPSVGFHHLVGVMGRAGRHRVDDHHQERVRNIASHQRVDHQDVEGRHHVDVEDIADRHVVENLVVSRAIMDHSVATPPRLNVLRAAKKKVMRTMTRRCWRMLWSAMKATGKLEVRLLDDVVYTPNAK
ncbi:hypothetical protein PC110_g18091 [Phytophthora cactorum]|uniref:Uncharacterized protein n=1 Tax=Phytophthora cactorum TaxID=29920 RepID=A0A329RQQ9_9STRA|nr:hypothetical protein PC110_g18091 [Phytophthora cactorum]